jgi:hypothetical protein
LVSELCKGSMYFLHFYKDDKIQCLQRLASGSVTYNKYSTNTSCYCYFVVILHQDDKNNTSPSYLKG